MKLKKSSKANLETRKSKFFLIGLVFALAFTLSAFEWRTFSKLKEYNGENRGEVVFLEEDLPDIMVKPKPEITVLEKKTVKSNTIEIVDKNDPEFINEKNDEIPDLDLPQDIDMDGEIFEETLILPEIPMLQPEIMPMFNCSDHSMQSLIKYMQSNVKYPQQARENNIQGKVYVWFVIDKHGKIGKIKANNNIAGGCTEEALRVVREMPDWCPGRQGNRNVAVEMVLPINFSLATN